MRLLFEMDLHDHARCTHEYARPSARAVIIRQGRVAMVYSRAYGYYKFPGGGVEAGEDPVEAMIREAREEAGLVIVPTSVKEYGYVHRVQKSDRDETERFVQDNYYYLCEAEAAVVSQRLDDYEEKEGFTLVFAEPHAAVRANRSVGPGPYNAAMFEREARVLELLVQEGLVR